MFLQVALPNSLFSSDHVALVCDLMPVVDPNGKSHRRCAIGLFTCMRRRQVIVPTEICVPDRTARSGIPPTVDTIPIVRVGIASSRIVRCVIYRSPVTA